MYTYCLPTRDTWRLHCQDNAYTFAPVSPAQAPCIFLHYFRHCCYAHYFSPIAGQWLAATYWPNCPLAFRRFEKPDQLYSRRHHLLPRSARDVSALTPPDGFAKNQTAERSPNRSNPRTADASFSYSTVVVDPERRVLYVGDHYYMMCIKVPE